MNPDSLHIETERPILLPPQRVDVDACAATVSDAEAAHFMGGQQARAVAWRGFLPLTRPLGAGCLGPARLPAPCEDAPIVIRVQMREQWCQRRAQP